MELKNNRKKEYIQKYKDVVQKIEEKNANQLINHKLMDEKEFDKKISQYGIQGKNLVNLTFDQKEKFVKYIDEEIALKKKISENYNMIFFVEQERLALQRKLKYDVLEEIAKLTNIANYNVSDHNYSSIEANKIISSTIILNRNNNHNHKKKNHYYEKQVIQNYEDKDLDFAEKKARIQDKIREIKNEWRKK